MPTLNAPKVDLAILERLLQPSRGDLPRTAAKSILGWEFAADDRERMAVLLERAKVGNLTASEKREAVEFERVGHLLALLKAKARRSLRTAKSA